jgi:hypothetical protein
MTIFISQGRYTAAAIRAMTTKPEDRSEAIAELLAAYLLNRHLVTVEIRSHVSATLGAGLANEPRLKIGQPQVTRSVIAADRD